MKAPDLKTANRFSGPYPPSVSIVLTIKQLPNLERLDIISTESLEEIPRQKSRGHVAGAPAELVRKEAEWTRKGVD